MNILDSRFYGAVDRLSNLFILNIFWIVSCLPIITIAPATTAMFSVVRQWKLKQDTSVVRNYFRYFKENFQQSFLIGLIWIILAVILFFNFFYMNQDQTPVKYVIIVPLFIISFLFICSTAYLFPLITHYKVTLKDGIKNSFFLSIAHFPTTLLLIGILALLTLILYYVPASSLIIFSVGAYIHYSMVNSVFLKLEQTAGNHPF